MACIILSLGSNLSDRLSMLSLAVRELSDHPDIEIEAVSKVYETAPVGFTEQGAFLNIAVRAKTNLSPDQLLQTTQRIEQFLGRKKTIRWGPRAIDIDIICYDQLALNEPHLEIPHKEALNRAFVLLPMLDVLPSEDFSLKGQKIRDVFKKTPHGKNIIWLFQETLPF